MKQPYPYLSARQTLDRDPTAYEDLLATTLEQAFGAGVDELEGIASALNQHGPAHPSEAVWTADLVATELKKLAEI